MSPEDRREIWATAKWTLALVIALSIFGVVFSFAMAHSDAKGIWLLIYWPVALVLLGAEQVGLKETMPSWLLGLLCFSALFGGYFLVVRAIRAIAKRRAG
jgi:hypothetical protein